MKLKKIAVILLSAVILPSFAAAGCGKSIDMSAAAATLDGKDISMGLANFMAQYQAVQMDSYLLSYYGEDMWSQDSGDGTTMTESVKKSVMENLQDCYLLDAHTADYDISLTEDEKKAITDAAAKFIEDNSADAIKTMGATQETVEEMLRIQTIQSKMRKAIEAEIDTNVSAKECAQKTFSYVSFAKPGVNEAIANNDSDTEKETEEDVKAKAEAFLEAAAENMEDAAETGEYTILTCSYGDGDLTEEDNTTSLDVSVLQAADKLKEGKLSDAVVETETNYYVLRMDSLDDKEAAEKKKESILSQRRDDKYEEKLKEYKDSCKWSIHEDAWEKVNFDELYTVKTAETETGTDDAGTDANNTGTGTDDAGTDADNAGTGTDDAGTDADNAETGTDDAGTSTDDAGTDADNAETGTDDANSAGQDNAGKDDKAKK